MIKRETVLSGADHPGTEIKVLSTPAGYYLGFLDKDGSPYSRETEYMPLEQAQLMLHLMRR